MLWRTKTASRGAARRRGVHLQWSKMGIIFAPNFVAKSRASKDAFTPHLPNSLFYPGKVGRSGGIRTHDPFTPSKVRYQAALRSDTYNFNKINALLFISRFKHNAENAPNEAPFRQILGPIVTSVTSFLRGVLQTTKLLLNLNCIRHLEKKCFRT